jgi:hypothetical protein
MKNPRILGQRTISKTFPTDKAGNTPIQASLFSMSVKQTFKKTKVLMFEQVGRNFYTEFRVSV